MEQNDYPEINESLFLNPKNIIKVYFYAILLCVATALIISLANPKLRFLINLTMAQSFGITICSITFLLLRIFKPRNWLTLILVIFTSIICGTLIGLNIGYYICEKTFSINMNLPIISKLNVILFTIILGGAGAYLIISKIWLSYHKEMFEQERIIRMALEKESLSANLRMLQAQIEPHFLFNTLSNVVSLIDTQPAKGKSMLLDLTKYLRTSLSRTLPQKTMLDQEIEMIKAYLNIQKIRMDERLNFEIDIPDHLRHLSFPPMLLQPLVENAVKHGLEPKIEGGEIVIRATEENNLLKIKVADTGIGFSDFNKPGVGIVNVRERLALLYGEKGRLIIEENKPQGVCVTIEVPLHDI